MASEIYLQFAILILTLALFFPILILLKQTQTKFRTKNRATLQGNRYFIQASNLLARARSTPHRAQTLTHAKNALIEAEKALSLSPRDPSAHIVKALALELLDRRICAVKSLDVALSPPCVRSLVGSERGDALIKRAELKLAMNRKRRVDSAVEDLVEAVPLGKSELKAFCLLGECYERKGMGEEAKEAYEKALRIEPESVMASRGLNRLGSFGS
ncbi:hypothetical protein UlMin_038806 [Ulmus minor]